tara:strand:+ start:553 stop:1467 length:915 start_codon:yes stop_codon:yes gene_type:complete
MMPFYTFSRDKFDPDDPSPWDAMFLDASIPMDDAAKGALLRGMQRPSRRVLLPFVRPLAGLAMLLIGGLRALVPNAFKSSRALHLLIYWGLRLFVTPEANWLILRHFHIGTELLQFIKDNIIGATIETLPLRPRSLEDLIDDVFLQHDLNIYSFIIQLNLHLKDNGEAVDPIPFEEIDFSGISDIEFPICDLPTSNLNFVDLQTAVISYTPLYQFFLSDTDFWRASNSLQLDETIGLYVSRILGSLEHMALVNNKHPLIPRVTLNAGFHLMLHGLAAEQLHFHLRTLKRVQCAQTTNSQSKNKT